MHVLQHLNPISFAFKEDAAHQQHLGFVAEDVPTMVATPDQKGFSPMAIIAVLTKVVKEQQEQLSAFHKDMGWLKDKVNRPRWMRLPMVIAVQYDLQREAYAREQLQRRLEVLRKAFATGQSRLREVERQPVSIRETLLQYSGARQVIEEVRAELPPEERAPPLRNGLDGCPPHHG